MRPGPNKGASRLGACGGSQGPAMLDGTTSVAGHGAIWEALARSRMGRLIPRRAANWSEVYQHFTTSSRSSPPADTQCGVYSYCVSFSTGVEVPQGQSSLRLWPGPKQKAPWRQNEQAMGQRPTSGRYEGRQQSPPCHGLHNSSVTGAGKGSSELRVYLRLPVLPAF